MSVVGVEIPARGFHRRVPENLLEHMQRDTGVSHPGRARVTEPVAGEIGQAEVRDDLVPVRRIRTVAVVNTPPFGPTRS